MINLDAKVAALRLFIDLILHEIAGFGNINAFIERFIEDRFTFEGYPIDSIPVLCAPDQPIPIAQHIWEDLHLDSTIIGNKFSLFPLGLQLTLLYDYLEDITSSALGVENMIPFFQQCFASQTYEFVEADKSKEFWKQR